MLISKQGHVYIDDQQQGGLVAVSVWGEEDRASTAYIGASQAIDVIEHLAWVYGLDLELLGRGEDA